MTPPSVIPPPPVLKKTVRVRAKVKKARKLLTTRSPWPPRTDPVLAIANPPAVVTTSTDHKLPRRRADTKTSNNGFDDLAVKPEHDVPIDGPCGDQGHGDMPTTTSGDDATDVADTSDEVQAKDTSSTNQPEVEQYYVQSNVVAEETTNIADTSTNPHDPSSYASHEGHAHEVQTQRSSQKPLYVDKQSPTIRPRIEKRTALPASRGPKSHPNFKPATINSAKEAEQRVTSSIVATDTASALIQSPRSHDTQHVLHQVSSHAAPIRVTKAQRNTRPMPTYRSASPAPNGSYAPSKMTALDFAMNSVRNAYLAEQNRVQDEMTSAVSSLQAEKHQLQGTMLEQQTLIGELQAKLERRERDLARLGERARTNAKYIAGIQKDHEKLQKSMDVSQKENKRALQEQIAELLEERVTLQCGYKLAIDTAMKSQKAMRSTMQELYMHYIMSLEREKNLEVRLNEQVRLYEDEKSRRIELEKYVLPSIQGVQHQLNEGSAVLSDKFGELLAALELRRAEDGNDGDTKECLLILQKLQSMRFLTPDDFQKAEGMLRFLYER